MIKIIASIHLERVKLLIRARIFYHIYHHISTVFCKPALPPVTPPKKQSDIMHNRSDTRLYILYKVFYNEKKLWIFSNNVLLYK